MTNSLILGWKNALTSDLIYQQDLKKIKPQNLENYFKESLDFGTAGMRALMGFGPNRINEFTIGAATQAYCKYLLSLNTQKKANGIIIGHDNRHNSKYYAEVAYAVLKQNKIKAYLFKNNRLQPTPLLSYTIRKLKLNGGIMITASHNPSQYNGFKIYNDLGAQLTNDITQKIQTYMQKIDPLKVQRSQANFEYVSDQIIEDYCNQVLKLQLRPQDQKVLKLVFSPQQGTTGHLGDFLLTKMKIEHFNVQKQMEPDPNFSKTKSPNPEDGRSYNRGIALARKKNADLVAVTDPDGDRLGVVVKQRRRYKYLNGNQLAALYLDYLLKQKKVLPKNGYIVKTVVSGQLASQIAKRYHLKVYETHVGFKNIAKLIESKNKTTEKFVFAYEESYGFLLDPNISRDKDALQSLVGVSEMANYYKTQGKNLYQKLSELYKEYGIFRSIVETQVIDQKSQDRVMSRLSKLKKVGDHKVLEIQDFRQGTKSLEPQNLIKIILSNGSWFAIRPSGTEPKFKIYIQTIGSVNQDLIDIVVQEKLISNVINDNIESPLRSKIKTKDIIRYTIFILTIAILLVVVFQYVYKGAQNRNVLDIAQLVFKSQHRTIWLGIIVWMVFTIVLETWIRKRMFDLQKEKIWFGHLLIASFMGVVITFITPFSIGGDIIGYWYLRKKGARRGVVLSVLISATIIYQAKIVLQTLVLLPIGFPIYQEFLLGDNSGARATLIWFLVGLSWNVFATIMIFCLTLNSNFQKWILTKSLAFLEWLPFVKIYDPGIIFAKIQYEFQEMRHGMRSLWTNWWIIFELLIYTFLPIIFQPHALVLALGGFVRDDLPRGPYWSQIVTWDIITTANSLSITPGGSGTGEWLNITVNQFLYKDSKFLEDNNLTAISLASGIDLNLKFIWDWPKILLSLLVVINVVIGEKRIKRYHLLNKNLHLLGKKKGRSTRVYYYTLIPWILILLFWVLLIFFYPV